MKNFLKKYWFLILVILLAIIRHAIMLHLTAYEIGSLIVDDTYVVLTSYALKAGGWQGDFSDKIMIKGVTAPFILSIISRLNISYILFSSVAYILASIMIVFSLKDFVKNKLALLMIYMILLFNPIMFGQEIVQRVYRNEFIPTLSLMIISFYFYIFNKSNLKISDIVIINMISGIFLGLFYNLREECVWIFPFIIFMSIVLIIKQKAKGLELWKSIVLFMVPMIVLLLINNTICFINYQYYGIYRRVDSVNTPYTRAYSYISKIDYPETDIRESVSKDKLEFLFTISPSLEKYDEEILAFLKIYDRIDENVNNQKLDNGWWNWTLRQSLGTTEVYKNSKTADEYYNNVYQELKQAEKEGKISLRKENYFDIVPKYIKILASSIKYAVSFQEIKSDISVKSIYVPESLIVDKLYREMTNDKFIYSEADIKEYKVANLEEQNHYLEKYGYVSDNLNNIIKIYRYINPIIFIIAIIAYFLSIIDLLKKDFKQINNWIIMSSLLGTMFTILCGYTYVDLTAFKAIRYEYISGAYGVMLLFEGLSIYYLIEKIKNRKIGETNERVK